MVHETNEMQDLSGYAVIPRGTPKGTNLIKRTPDEAIFDIRYVLRFWWPLLPIALATMTVFGAPALGVAIGIALSDRYDNYVSESIWTCVAISAIATCVSYFKTKGNVRVVVQKDKIRFGDKIYDRNLYGGMRIGYSVDGRSDALKNDFFDQSMGATALRLSYGPWGEDLSYLVSKYHAAEIVIWMNEVIDSVGKPPPKENAPSEGRREQNF